MNADVLSIKRVYKDDEMCANILTKMGEIGQGNPAAIAALKMAALKLKQC